MTDANSTTVSRRRFLLGAGGVTAAAAGLTLYRLKTRQPTGRVLPAPPPKDQVRQISYGDYADIYREQWTWDKVVKGTHTRANCISACSWDVYVKEGIVWREEQDTVYRQSRPDTPDFNPRGCQKGACYSDLQASESRVTHPLKRAGERGEGKWKRISWDQALEEIADKMIDAAIEQGSESIIYDNGTTNAGFGPETAGEIRFAQAVEATMIDSWAGVGDLPMGAIQTWGMYNCEGTSDDWFRSDYIVIWIGNPSITRIPEMHFMHEARYRGARLVVIAPDMSASTLHADLWINPKPETDAALGLAVAHHIIENDLYQADYIKEQTDLPILVRKDTDKFLRESDLVRGGADNLFYFWDQKTGKVVEVPGCEGDGWGGRSLALGKIDPALSVEQTVALNDGSEVAVYTVFDRLRIMLGRQYTPEKAAEITGLSPKLIRRFARELAAAPSAMIFASWGACKHYHSDLFQRAMILLMSLTGNQGKPGGGMRIAAWWNMDGLDRMAGHGMSTMDMLKLMPKAVRGMTPRDYEETFGIYSGNGANSPLMPFLYVHGGYKELWDRDDMQDDTLPDGTADYIRQSIDNNWITMHPAEDREPRVFIFTGCNPLRRWPAPQYALKGLWPKLDCVVSVNFRMSTTSLYADYFLPVAGYYEKHGIKYGQTYVPYICTSDKAVEPLGESKSDWEVFGLISKAVAERAAARGVTNVRGFKDRPLDLTQTYRKHTSDGEYDPLDPQDPVKLIDAIFRNSPNCGNISGQEALEMGAVPLTGPARPSLIYQTSSDYDPNDTHWPHRWFVEDKVAWPTITGRQQFMLDHPWYVEAGEDLPVHKDPPHARSQYPLRINGGHTRWSIHAIWRDHKLMLQLQRGQPVCIMNPADCEARNIGNGDMARVYNDIGEFESMVKVAPATQPGEVIIYHAWEPYQFKGWKGQQEPVAAPWKAIHLAGGYGQLHYRVYYGAPGYAPRGAPVEVELA